MMTKMMTKMTTKMTTVKMAYSVAFQIYMDIVHRDDCVPDIRGGSDIPLSKNHNVRRCYRYRQSERRQEGSKGRRVKKRKQSFS